MQSELQWTRSHLAEVEAAAVQTSSLQTAAAEVEHLRAQLNDVRRQLIKRDVEDEADLVAPRSLIEREAQGRQVFPSSQLSSLSSPLCPITLLEKYFRFMKESLQTCAKTWSYPTRSCWRRVGD